MNFEPPEPGSWILDRSHYDSGMTPLSSELMGDAVRRAYEKIFDTLGIPLRTIDFQAVNGFPFGRRVPLIEPRKADAAPPPDWLVRILVRVVPEFRRRNRNAAAFLASPTSDAVVAEWQAEIRPRLLARNAELQAIDLATIDDEALAAHLDVVLDHVQHTVEEHHRLHGYDLVPIGLLLLSCNELGIDPLDVLPLLAGASPATAEPVADRLRIRQLTEEAGVTPTSLGDIRNASAEAAAALDAYLDRHGGVLFASYDVDSPTLGERPDIVLGSILSAEPFEDPETAVNARIAELRMRVPDRAEFDRLLTSARSAMNMRDDNGPLTVEWPVGLLRLALLELGRRLAAGGRIDQAEHTFELKVDEVLPLARGGETPSATVLTERARLREESRSLDPPATLGPIEPDPDFSLLPPPMARMLELTEVVTEHMLTAEQADAGELTMRGIGISAEPFEGIARIAATAEEAMAALEDGEILVTRATSPAFNLVLSMAGGLVTAEGGAMSHAAVLARELELPSVVGAVGCLDKITNGDRIRLDPANGLIEILR